MSLPRMIDGDIPWLATEFVGWSIVGMNHYHVGMTRVLFVAMTRGGHCIKEEGPDTIELWHRLAAQAKKAYP